MMLVFGLWQVLVIAFWVVALVIPTAKILQRAGHSGWWSVLIFFPIINLVALWMFAYARWPACDGFREVDGHLA